MSQMQEELMELLKLKPKKGEERQTLLKRIVIAVTALSDEEFSELPKQTEDWANAASRANDKEKPIPDFPDFKTTDAEGADKESKDMPKTDKKAAAPAKEAKAPKAAAEKKAPAKKGGGKIHQMKQIILKNLGISTEDLTAKVKAAGLEVSDSTVTTVRSDFLSSIRVLQEAKLLTKNLLGDD